MFYTDLFQHLGLARNEAILYEALLKYGDLNVSELAEKADIHRRNVYDSLNRLLEKGLVLSALSQREKRFQAVTPQKLSSLLEEKQKALAAVMPKLEKLHDSKPHTEEIYILRGMEGWKYYMREILRLSEDVFTLGAKGGWNSTNLGPFLNQFIQEIERREINQYIIYDASARQSEGAKEMKKVKGVNIRFLPAQYNTDASIDIFGDRVVILSRPHDEGEPYDSFTIIVNQAIADAYRKWWWVLWESCPKIKKSRPTQRGG